MHLKIAASDDHLLAAAVLLLFLWMVLSPSANARTVGEPPLSRNDVIRLLKGKVSVGRVEELAKQRGIDFEITPEAETEMRSAGATVALLNALRKLTPMSPAPSPVPPALVITSNPGGAQVYVDDEPNGTTSPEGRLKLTTLLPGQHQLRISSAGYRDYEASVDLILGQTATVLATLARNEVQLPPIADVADHGVGGSLTSSVSFELWHVHGRMSVHTAHGILQIPSAGLVFTESGDHANPKHDFKASCSGISEAKPSSPLYCPACLHIVVQSESYDLRTKGWGHRSDAAEVQSILQAISSSCEHHQ